MVHRNTFTQESCVFGEVLYPRFINNGGATPSDSRTIRRTKDFAIPTQVPEVTRRSPIGRVIADYTESRCARGALLGCLRYSSYSLLA